MEKTLLGNTSLEVTSIGIGTWSWGDKLFWNYGKEYGPSEVAAAFKTAVDCGITFFDTAEVYGLGESETLLGQFIPTVSQPIDIATKFGPLPWRFSQSSVQQALDASLKRLKQNQISLYQVHWPFTFWLSQETLMNSLADAVQSGKIKAIGVSNYSASQMREAHQILAQRGIPLAVNQVQYSLLHRQIESNGIFSTAQSLGVTILAYSPLAQGLLTGKYHPNNPKPQGARNIDPRFSEQGLSKIAPVLDLLKQLGDRYQKTPAQIALNWLIGQGNTIPIPGAKNSRQAQENAGGADWRLSTTDQHQLSQLTEQFTQSRI